MPFVRNVYFNHPTTGSPGLWVETTSGLGLVGKARILWPPVQLTGTDEEKRVAFEALLNTALQALFEETITLAGNDPKLTNPEIGCRRGSGNNYIMRHTTIFVPVLSVNPTIVLGAVELTEAAARSYRV